MKSNRGFTLLELAIATLVGTILIAGAFAVASSQMKVFARGKEVSKMQISTRTVFEAIARDVRNAGAGTSFYAGVSGIAFDNGALQVTDTLDGSTRGVPAIRVANNINDFDVMAGSDAIMLIRPTSGVTFTVDHVPCNPNPGTPFLVNDFTVLTQCANDNGLVLISNATRSTSEPEAMILPLDGGASIVNQSLIFDTTYDFDPGSATRCTDRSVPPLGAARGSQVMCVQPVTYWVDRTARLRMWRSTPADPAGTNTIFGSTFGQAVINPAQDLVLAEGVEDLQFAVFLSSMAPGGGGWTLSSAGGGGGSGSGSGSASGSGVGGGPPVAEEVLAEARRVRTSVLLRTSRNLGSAERPRPNQIEDHVLPATRQSPCFDFSVCFDPSYSRRLLVFESEIRSMRLFDLLADPNRQYTDVRSYLE